MYSGRTDLQRRCGLPPDPSDLPNLRGRHTRRMGGLGLRAGDPRTKDRGRLIGSLALGSIQERTVCTAVPVDAGVEPTLRDRADLSGLIVAAATGQQCAQEKETHNDAGPCHAQERYRAVPHPYGRTRVEPTIQPWA